MLWLNVCVLVCLQTVYALTMTVGRDSSSIAFISAENEE